MAAPVSTDLVVNGLRLRHLDWGAATSPPVLALHGLRSYAHTWDVLAEALAGSHRVIAPDFRGRGNSEWDPARDYFTNAYVCDIEALVDRLDLQTFAIIGHSMGGAVAYAYAARHPNRVSALVIEDIGPGSSTASGGAERIVREMRNTPGDFASLDAARAYWRSIRPAISEQALASRVTNTVRDAGDGRWVWQMDMQGIAAARLAGDPAGPVDLWECVESLRCPTLVIRGADSDFLPEYICTEMAARQPLLRWTAVPDAGHYVHDDAPETFARLVADFLG
ncbi:alpha/beta hydrolase [Mycolicibacterium sp. CH28]|uniref:alpha/beta fold hydrolase n=1 Tax=Mycolicibacterium sp. CH28 TaxID=2512237 RepID=UPI00107FDE2C|nr:alpha/beta hydrolase [Mycolicibacterium sp. CH28]TGD87552.1 alpha/beta hydrolase [Mycolicibacterium sp. CH28]